MWVLVGEATHLSRRGSGLWNGGPVVGDGLVEEVGHAQG
jgi:hypothetical protein